MKKYYITTSIAYPNANPHIGYAYELVQADFLARYYRMSGHDVRFVTGVDAHGLKIQQTAAKRNMSPADFVNEQKDIYQKLADTIGVKYDRFISTEDEDHIAQSQCIWTKCMEKSDIYKKRYSAWYDIKEEEFLGLAEEGEDINSREKAAARFGVNAEFIEFIDEENYFFALSRFKDQIFEILSKDEYKIVPQNRKLELLNFVRDNGLNDISISRDRSKLSWGISVPGDESQVMYVWFDALINYITAAKFDGEDCWPADLHCVGKDIARFHALIWTGMLLSAKIELPKELLVHGFINHDGRKMSKSWGNVVDPMPLLEKYGSAAIRWFLLKEIPSTDDGDYSDDRLNAVYTADLANDYGNLVSRVWNMAQKYFDGKVPDLDLALLGNVEQMLVEEKWLAYHAFIEKRDINSALNEGHDLVVMCNRWIEENKPWVLAKDPDKELELAELIYELLETIRHITLMFYPVMPNICERVFRDVYNVSDLGVKAIEEGGYDAEFTDWGGLMPGSDLGKQSLILFPRLEVQKND